MTRSHWNAFAVSSGKKETVPSLLTTAPGLSPFTEESAESSAGLRDAPGVPELVTPARPSVSGVGLAAAGVGTASSYVSTKTPYMRPVLPSVETRTL